MEVLIFFRREMRVESHDIIINILTEERLSESVEKETGYPAEVISILKQAKNLNDFKGSVGDILIIYPKKTGDNVQIFVGLGNRLALNPRIFQDAGALLSRKCADLKMNSVILDLSKTSPVDPYKTIKPFVEGIAIGSYSFRKYFSEKKVFPMGMMGIVIPDDMDKEQAEKSIEDAAYTVIASNIARHLTNEASNYKTPARFEQLAREILSSRKLKIHTLDCEKLEKQKLNLLRAVGQAGSDLPRLLIMEAKKPRHKKTIGIVGKAVTFDAGGLMLKSSTDLPHMREDVGGAAALIGVLSVIDQLNLKYNVVAAIPIAENLIDSKSYRPADVIITRKGLSVEVNNTDAEGRLLLADSFLYLQDMYSLDALIDVATLTGAITRALGNKMAGYFTNNETLATLLETACSISLEKFWRMPLEQSYAPNLKSSLADVKNDGGEPKAITAALFLQRFVPEGLPWLHLDVGSIVNPSSNDILYGNFTYATGIPSITLIELLKQINSNIERLF